MKLVPITHIPERRKKRNKTIDTLIEFMMSDNKYAIVSYTSDEYATDASCANNLHRCARDNSLPINVYRRGGKVYLEKL